jgi:hypothetical protein
LGATLPPPLDLLSPFLPIPPGTEFGGSMAAFATCTLQSNDLGSFPAAFGGGRLPHILPDP